MKNKKRSIEYLCGREVILAKNRVVKCEKVFRICLQIFEHLTIKRKTES